MDEEEEIVRLSIDLLMDRGLVKGEKYREDFFVWMPRKGIENPMQYKGSPNDIYFGTPLEGISEREGEMYHFNLEKTGIAQPKEIFHNFSYEELFRHETDPSLEGYERGVVTKLGPVAVDTGRFTGRSPKDKYIVRDSYSEKELPRMIFDIR